MLAVPQHYILTDIYLRLIHIWNNSDFYYKIDIIATEYLDSSDDISFGGIKQKRSRLIQIPPGWNSYGIGIMFTKVCIFCMMQTSSVTNESHFLIKLYSFKEWNYQWYTFLNSNPSREEWTDIIKPLNSRNKYFKLSAISVKLSMEVIIFKEPQYSGHKDVLSTDGYASIAVSSHSKQNVHLQESWNRSQSDS